MGTKKNLEFGCKRRSQQQNLSIDKIESLKPKKNTILLSKDGSIGIAYKLENNLEAVTSGAILHLKAKKDVSILPDYLTF